MQNLAYIYDLAGNVLEIDDWRADISQCQVFAYDELNRLTSATAYNEQTGQVVTR